MMIFYKLITVARNANVIEFLNLCRLNVFLLFLSMLYAHTQIFISWMIPVGFDVILSLRLRSTRIKWVIQNEISFGNFKHTFVPNSCNTNTIEKLTYSIHFGTINVILLLMWERKTEILVRFIYNGKKIAIIFCFIHSWLERTICQHTCVFRISFNAMFFNSILGKYIQCQNKQ